MSEINMIFGEDVTIETILMLHNAGMEFVIEDGQISEVIF